MKTVEVKHNKDIKDFLQNIRRVRVSTIYS